MKPEINFKQVFETFAKKLKVNLLQNEKRADHVINFIEELKKIRFRDPNSPLSAKEMSLLEGLQGVIQEAANRLPGCYRAAYIEPILNNLASVQLRAPGTLETLAGAIYDHSSDVIKKNHLQGFCSLTSNIYRSFLEPERLPISDFPKPHSRLPALATFRPQLENRHLVPFTLTANEVFALCGSKVAIVSLPACYRDHPILTWASIAHEAGGHDVLRGYPGLLPELKRGVRELFYKGPDPATKLPESTRQFLGLLWQHWTEETAAHIYAVMNLGPSYGLALIIYFAALSEQIRHFYKKKSDSSKRDYLSTIPVSSLNGKNPVDYHPTPLLSIYAVIGAIDALPLDTKIKHDRIGEIESWVEFCLKKNSILIEKYKKASKKRKEILPYDTEVVYIEGWLPLKPGNRVWLPPKKIDFQVKFDDMCEHARRVGYYIATAKLDAFNGHTIQDLETWDSTDEIAAETISKKIINYSVNNFGEASQLFSGALLALKSHPGKYDLINDRLVKALKESFKQDDIWGKAFWHPIADV